MKFKTESRVGFALIGALALASVIYLMYRMVQPPDEITPSPPAIRYHCDDDTDTTKGTAKGVLTNCKPVVIERRM